MRARHPGENAFNAVAKRRVEGAMRQVAGAAVAGRLVDIGCGLKPYAHLFAPHVTEHVGVDHPESPHAGTAVDVLASAYEIPLEDASFDCALLSELLEHLERPGAALREAHRLLRPGGRIVITTPFVWPIHEAPRDFYRYSPYGLRHLLDEAGFTDIEITPLSGQWVTLHLLHVYALRRSPLRRAGRALEAYARLHGRAAEYRDARRPHEWMSFDHLAVARRP